jgi:hypothetical protein
MNQFVWFSPYGLNSAQYIDLSSLDCIVHALSTKCPLINFFNWNFLLSKNSKAQNKSETENCLEFYNISLCVQRDQF